MSVYGSTVNRNESVNMVDDRLLYGHIQDLPITNEGKEIFVTSVHYGFAM